MSASGHDRGDEREAPGEDHLRTREALGAYLIGALEPDERHVVEAHLDTCRRCREELSRFAPLPQLLGRLAASEAAEGSLVRQIDVLPSLLREAARERTRLRRRLRAWRVATAAALAAAVMVWAPWESGPQATEAPAVAVAADAGSVEGRAALYSWEWGTTVDLDLGDVPFRDRYEIWVVTVDAEREHAGTWGPTASGQARVRGACAVDRDRIARIEVLDSAGEMLLEFAFDR